MGRNIRFWIAPGLKNDNVLTPSTLTIHADGRVAVIEVRPPLKGEQGWQCWPDTPLEAQIRELLADWGGDPPGWTAPHAEENGNAADCFYITVLAAFDLPPAPVTPRHSINPIRMHTQAELVTAQGFKPGAEAKAANDREFAADGVTKLSEVWSAAHTPPGGSEARAWTAPIVAAMNRMEELGGSSSDADYLEVMDWVAIEAARRARDLRSQLDGRTVDGATSGTLAIELEFDGDASIAHDALSNVLDAGTLQDAIREYADDNGHEMIVTSAVLK